jgi:hypothetical protein
VSAAKDLLSAQNQILRCAQDDKGLSEEEEGRRDGSLRYVRAVWADSGVYVWGWLRFCGVIYDLMII